jgi:3D (Asp-Asp-Asp) domain-containing protein
MSISPQRNQQVVGDNPKSIKNNHLDMFFKR